MEFQQEEQHQKAAIAPEETENAPPMMQLRLENIARNNAMLVEIGIEPTTVPVVKAKQTRRRRPRVPSADDDTRVSERPRRTNTETQDKNNSKIKCSTCLFDNDTDSDSDDSEAPYNYETLTDIQIEQQDSLIVSKVGQTFIDRF